MSASTKTRFTGIIALGLIAAALIPAAPAVAAPVGGIVDANPAADHGDAVVTATLRRDPGAADPFLVQAPSSGQQATDNGDLSTFGAVALIGGVALAVTAIAMTAGASSDRRRRTAPAQPGDTAPIV